MIKQLTEYLNYGLFAEVALVLFAMIFLVVVIRTLRTSGDVTTQQAKIVLGEKTTDPRENRS